MRLTGQGPQATDRTETGRSCIGMPGDARRDPIVSAPRCGTGPLRASLTAAVSVLALLLLGAHGAMATPIIETPWAAPLNHVRGETVPTRTRPGEPAGAYIFAPLTAGDGAMYGNYRGASPYAAGQSALMRLARSPPAEAIGGTGDWRGQDNSGDSVFVGTTGTFLLLDSPVSTQSVASASFGFTYSPKPASGEDRALTLDDTPVQAEPAPPTAFAATAPSLASDVPPPILTPASQAGRTYAVSIPGASALRTAKSSGADSAPANIRPGTASKALIAEFQRIVRQAPHDPDNGDWLASLASRGFRPTPPEVAKFTVSAGSAVDGLARNTAVSVPIRIVNTGPGELSSSLMVFVDQSVAAGNGDVFNFFFDRVILR